MYIILIQHEGFNHDKKFVFDCTSISGFVKLGDTVICQTIHGQSLGKAVTNPIQISGDYESIGQLLKPHGAYLPLKKIIGVVQYRELTESEKEQIAKEWLKERLGNELPF